MLTTISKKIVGTSGFLQELSISLQQQRKGVQIRKNIMVKKQASYNSHISSTFSVDCRCDAIDKLVVHHWLNLTSQFIKCESTWQSQFKSRYHSSLLPWVISLVVFGMAYGVRARECYFLFLSDCYLQSLILLQIQFLKDNLVWCF